MVNTTKPDSIRAKALDIINTFPQGVTAVEIATLLEKSPTIISNAVSIMWFANQVKRDFMFDDTGKVMKAYKYFPIWADQGVFSRDQAPKVKKLRKSKKSKTAHSEQFVLDDDAIAEAVNTITTIPNTDDGWLREIRLPTASKPKAPFKVEVQYAMSAGDQWIEITKEQYEALLEAFDFGEDK